MATATKEVIPFEQRWIEVDPVVVVTSDVDCDGVGYGYHRVLVPSALSRHTESAKWFAVMTEQMSDYGDACEVMTEARFRERMWDEMNTFARRFWEVHHYHGVFVGR